MTIFLTGTKPSDFVTYGTVTLDTDPARSSGGEAISVGARPSYVALNYPAVPEIWQRFDYYVAGALTNNEWLLILSDSERGQFYLRAVGGNLQWQRISLNPSSITNVGAAFAPPPVNTLTQVDIRVNHSAGILEVYYDGVLVSSVTTAAISQLRQTQIRRPSVGNLAVFSNVIVADEDTRAISPGGSGTITASFGLRWAVSSNTVVTKDAVTARYWRLELKEGGGTGTTVSLAELTLYGTSGAFAKTGATVTAHATWGGSETPDKAYDGNAATHWAGRTDGNGLVGWLQVDYGSAITVTGFGVIFRNELSTIPGTLQLKYSNDGVTWSNFSGVIRNKVTPGNGHSPAPVAGVEYRYGYNRTHWRVRITEIHISGFQTGPGLQELEFRSAAGVPEIPINGRPFANGEWGTSESIDKAFDGNPATNWGKDQVPGVAGYRFPATKSVAEVYIQARTGSDNPKHAPKAFVLEYSNDIELTWIEQARYADIPPWQPLEERTFSGVAQQPITQSFSFPWVLADTSIVTAEFAFPWNVVALDKITQEFDLLWNVTGAITAEFELPWAIEGVAAIDAEFSFLWSVEGEAPADPITATFSLLWVIRASVDLSRLIVPDYPVTELWTFQTAIFRSRNGREERRARISRPVITQQFTAPAIDPEDFQRARRALEIDTDQFYPVPLFQYYAYLDAPAAAGETRLYFSQERTNVVPGQYVALMSEGRATFLAPVEEIHSDGVTLAFGIGEVDRDYYACPVIFCRLGMNASSSHSPRYADVTLNYVSAERELDFIRPDNPVTLTMFSGYPLLADRIIVNSTIQETLLSGNTIIDNARANPVLFVKEGTRRQFAVSYKAARMYVPGAMDFWRRFFGYIKGQQKPFVMPTFRSDATPVGAIPAGATEITLAGRDFFDVWQKGGYVGLALGYDDNRALVQEVARVIDVNELGGNSVCTLATPTIGDDYTHVSFLMLVRCATDQVQLTHTDVETTLTFSVQMVNG